MDDLENMLEMYYGIATIEATIVLQKKGRKRGGKVSVWAGVATLKCPEIGV